ATARRAAAGAVALLLLSGVAVASPETTRSELRDAKKRLNTLQTRIQTEQARVVSIQASMRKLAHEVATTRSSYDILRSRLARTQARIADTEARYAAIRARIEEAIADAYIRGRTYAYEALLGSTSLSDAADVIYYTNAI